MNDRELRDWQEAKRLRGPDATEVITLLPDTYAAFQQIHDAGMIDGMGAPDLSGAFIAHLERVLARHKAGVRVMMYRLQREDNLGWQLLDMTWIPTDGRREPDYSLEDAAAVLAIPVEEAAGRRRAALRRITQWANEGERRDQRRSAAVLAQSRRHPPQGGSGAAGLPRRPDRAAG